MMHLYRRTQQTAELVSHIQKALTELNFFWIYGGYEAFKSANAGHALSVYEDSFHKLVELTHSSDPVERHVTLARFQFISAHVTTRLIESELGAPSHANNWKFLLQDTLLISRTQAISERDITKHLTKAEIMRLPLVDRVSVAVVSRFLADELARGHMVCGSVDARTKWWAPSVARIVEWWVRKLACHAIQTALLHTERPEFQRLDRAYWIDSLSMPAEIFDWTAEQNWAVTARPVMGDITASGSQEDLRLTLIDGGG